MASALGHASWPLTVWFTGVSGGGGAQKVENQNPPRELELVIGGQDVQLHLNFR